MAKIKVQSGRSMIEMDNDLEPLVRQACEQSQPGLLTALERAAEDRLREARARWPVGRERERPRPHSRDLWTTFTALGRDFVRAGLDNEAGRYVYQIKTFQGGLRGESPFQVLVRRPMLEQAAELGAIGARVIAGK